MKNTDSTKTRILLIRHGESVSNLSKAFAGHTDIPLTEKGLKQAQITAEYLKNTHIDIMYSSDLLRAFSTAREVASRQSCELIKDPRLREICGGSWEGMSYADIELKYPEIYRVWKNDIGNVALPEGESVSQVQGRIYKRICEIAEQHAGKTVCLVTHAMAIRAFSAKVKKIPLSEFNRLPWAENASVTTVTYENGIFTLECYGYDTSVEQGHGI